MANKLKPCHFLTHLSSHLQLSPVSPRKLRKLFGLGATRRQLTGPTGTGPTGTGVGTGFTGVGPTGGQFVGQQAFVAPAAAGGGGCE